MGDKDSRHSFIGDLIKYGFLIALVGGIAWYFLADKFRKTKEVQNVKTNFALGDVDSELKSDIDGKLNPPKGVAAAGTSAYYWKVYYKHQPPAEVNDPKCKLYIDAKYKHDVNKSKRSDGDGTSKHYTPGTLVFQLRVKQQKGVTKTMYKKRYEKPVKSIIVQHAGEGISDERKRKAFKDAESNFVKFELGPQLTLAALGLIEETKKLDDAYTPALVEAILSSHKGVSSKALEILKDFKPKDTTMMQEAIGELKKRGGLAKEKHTVNNAEAAQEFLKKRVEKAK